MFLGKLPDRAGFRFAAPPATRIYTDRKSAEPGRRKVRDEERRDKNRSVLVLFVPQTRVYLLLRGIAPTGVSEWCTESEARSKDAGSCQKVPFQ